MTFYKVNAVSVKGPVSVLTVCEVTDTRLNSRYYPGTTRRMKLNISLCKYQSQVIRV